ncbi:hypothetical protein [Entomobacter blattae]|uniref:Thiocillin family RiPP n=1 Tax=Entomobacter blattae TaxID=2762277 RepID=A0A7H1NSQ0_9PROT|nr:hypothetical protein [Entomobacter blattae]QNT78810.1 hypothetical protein JGUZn3_15870 [Entomobacter blattae]
MNKTKPIQKSSDLQTFEEYFKDMDIDFLLNQVSGGETSCFGSVGTAGTAGTVGTVGTFGSGSSSMCMGCSS